MSQSVANSRARAARVRSAIANSFPTLAEAALVAASALLTVLSFPNFDLWFLAWVSLVPLLLVVANTRRPGCAFMSGWLWGIIFFYGTCWWLTYPMIHYAHISAWLAYPLFLLPVVFVALFPALACGLTARLVNQFGSWAIVIAPLIWVSIEWLRYAITGQLWNALGYSQAFEPWMIQTARWGGVYAISFAIAAVNAAIVFIFTRWTLLRLAATAFILVTIAAALVSAEIDKFLEPGASDHDEVVVIAVQPNVPMDLAGDPAQMDELLKRHFEWTERGIGMEMHGQEKSPRLVIWPESPMNFSYSRDPHLREVVGNFARTNHTSILLNSLEPAAGGGDQNSAILVNEKGEMSARYDKIRLMPFGEYVPLPRWLPGASSVRGLVGEFKPGSSYTLMPLGAIRAGVFICIEAAHPGIARSFRNKGADVLINISNDGYLGPTPVMRQHLANAILRAVENDRDLIRVTNTGLTANIRSDGQIFDQTTGFHEDVRAWVIGKGESSTYYSRHGDLFAYGCALISLGIISASFMRRRVSAARP